MKEHSLTSRLENLQSKLQLLLDSHQSLREETKCLNQENEGLKGEITALQGQLEDFQNQEKITKIVSSSTVEKEEATELKYKLNEYIKEIDRCIAHLS